LLDVRGIDRIVVSERADHRVLEVPDISEDDTTGERGPRGHLRAREQVTQARRVRAGRQDGRARIEGLRESERQQDRRLFGDQASQTTRGEEWKGMSFPVCRR